MFTQAQEFLSKTSLSPRLAIIISFIVGYIGIFLPWGYISATVEADSRQPPLTIFSWGKDLPEINGCWNTTAEWVSEPANWIFKVQTFLETPIRMLPVLIWVLYLGKHVTKTPQTLLAFLLASLVLALIPTFLILALTRQVNLCDPPPHLLVRSSSFFWPTILVWAISISLGIYAVSRPSQSQRHNLIRRDE